MLDVGPRQGSQRASPSNPNRPITRFTSAKTAMPSNWFAPHENGELLVQLQSGLNIDTSAPPQRESLPPSADGALCANKQDEVSSSNTSRNFLNNEKTSSFMAPKAWQCRIL